MQPGSYQEVYSPREIAEAAGVPAAEAIAALGGRSGFVPHSDAVQLGRALRSARPPFLLLAGARERPLGVFSRASSLAVSSSLHVGAIAAAIGVMTLGLAPSASNLEPREERVEPLRMVFMVTPGPGGGGGGGGLRHTAPPPKALREGRHRQSSPMPARTPPPQLDPPERPDTPPEPLSAEPLPAVVAPIVASPADDRDRAGLLAEARSENATRGAGQGGGVGRGDGTGIGDGHGAGVGPGSGGGTGGGPFRPGSGIAPPRLIREVKADYTDDARRRGLEGDVVLEIVVHRDGSVGNVRTVQRLGGGLDERAAQAVRLWRFAPATRLGAPVDVIVEVVVEFKLR